MNLPAINPVNNKIRIDHNACSRCDKCFDVCSPKALEPVGTWWSVENLLDSVLIDRKYFRSTGGGVTVSGGEPTLQMDFLHHFLAALKQESISIGLETSGMFSLKTFKQLILPYLDFIYFDLKLIQSAESRKFTGCSNDQIIENFLFLTTAKAVPVIPRVPLIPDITATEENLNGISKFLKMQGIEACNLLPYNPLWLGKTDKYGLEIKYSHGEYMSPEEEEKCIRCF